MPNQEEVSQFIKAFNVKLDFWDVIIRTDRTNDKNNSTILALELTYTAVKNILKTLKVEEYSEGPLPDVLYNISDMWIFGKIIKGHEVYIKIQLGRPQSQVICISFHFAERKMNYPFKT